MKHVELINEIAKKLEEAFDAALKEGGLSIAGAVNQAVAGIQALLNWKKPEEPLK